MNTLGSRATGHAAVARQHQLLATTKNVWAPRPTSFGRVSSAWVVAHARSGTKPGSGDVWTEFVAETLLPTNLGKFRLRGYRHTTDSGTSFSEPSAIITGHVEDGENVVVRVHDACWTSEVIGSLKCDCREQLHLAMRYIQDQPPGIVIYCQQEGRGIGLANKIAAYALQERGLDTVQANRALGLPDDCREYSAVRHILHDLGVKSIRLMTNNPRKISELEALGIVVTGRVPCIVEAGEHNQSYLNTKERKMQHLLSVDEELELDGSSCYWNHEGEPGSSGVAVGMGMDMSLAKDEAAVMEALRQGSIEEFPGQHRVTD